MYEALKKALEDFKAGRFEAAHEGFNALPAAARETEPALVLLANLHAKAGRPAEAGLAFLKLCALPAAAVGNYARMAVKLLSQTGEGAIVATNAERLLRAAEGDADTCAAILAACEAAGRYRESAGHVGRLDLSNPHQAMLGLRLLRAAERHNDVIPFLDKVLTFRPDDGLFNAERFSEALNFCHFDVAEECEAAILAADTPRGRNMSAAEAMHRRLLWSDDPAYMNAPALEKRLIEVETGGAMPPPRRPISATGEKLRIAYLSNDFYSHATMTLMRQVLLEHDRGRFDIGLFCYTEPAKAVQQADWPAALRNEIITIAALSHQEAAARISEWRADILVDLKGFTGGARPAIVKLSDAPIKAEWLGHPGSVPWIDLDYCIADPVVVPPGAEGFFEEKLCRLPETYQPNDAVSRPLPIPQNRADHGLPEGAFVFANFNSAAKVTRRMIALWASLLRETPGSVFWCLAPSEPALGNIKKAFTDHGIAADRLTFAPPMAYADHINRIPLADLAVDTYPCGGHTTTSDILWAGLPVLTLAGKGFAARVCASLLTAIGAPELIVETEENYVRVALELARDQSRLSALRSRIVDNRFKAPLFDSERFTRHLEQAFEAMAERARAGLKPDHIHVPALAPREGSFSASRQRF
ncbi:hypothetical protein [Rhizobium sp. L1K21]|uniref:O-linked N-acetylglucosamine transferase, SPINDLY family protein n=1 Tax=Rhizobium sp. L1K21 TaxID=2954933 RepID=UPI0020922DE7|nr:hypothetical protein [Rhizobium sp. L1K21]MCO6186744.1 hypothetical protein [Rhizobium sp. L1K21]